MTPPKLDPKKKHTIEAVVDRFKVRADVGQRLAESFETALRLADGVARVSFMDDAEARRAGVLRQVRLPGLRLQPFGARAAAVLVQQPGGRVPDVRGPGRAAVLRSGARRPPPALVARRRRDPRLGPPQRLLLRAHAIAGAALQVRHRGALAGPVAEAPEGRAVRQRRRQDRLPLRRRARRHDAARAQVRRRHPEPGTPLPRNRIARRARGAREVPQQSALPRMRRHAPEPRGAQRVRRRAHAARDRAARGRRRAALQRRAANWQAGAARSPPRSSRRSASACGSSATSASTT